MSQFVGAALTVPPLIQQDDKRNVDEWWADNEDIIPMSVLLSDDWRSTAEALGFVSPWWPMSGQFIGEATGDLITPEERHDIWRSFGANGRLAFVGYTRDAYGSPVGNCTVRCFVTATNELVSQVTSNANGYYIATSPYSDAHYLTVHKSGSPPIAGASVDTLTPS